MAAQIQYGLPRKDAEPIARHLKGLFFRWEILRVADGTKTEFSDFNMSLD